MSPSSRAVTWGSALLAAAAAAAVILLLNGPWHVPGFGVHSLRERVDNAGAAGPLVFMALLAACIIFAPVPNTPFYIVAGAIWGPIVGSAYAMSGAVAGSTLAFLLARTVPREAIYRLAGAELRRRMEDPRLPPAGWVVFWARLLPATNFDWINYLAGLTSVRLIPFIAATTFGMGPATIATVVAGSTVEHQPVLALVIVVAWLAVLVATWPLAVRRWRRAMRDSNAD